MILDTHSFVLDQIVDPLLLQLLEYHSYKYISMLSLYYCSYVESYQHIQLQLAVRMSALLMMEVSCPAHEL